MPILSRCGWLTSICIISASVNGDVVQGRQPRFGQHQTQQMLMLLGALAHNVVIWARQWLMEAAAQSKLRHYGILSMVHDIFPVSGFLILYAWDHIAHRPDFAEPGGTFDIHLSRFVAGATGIHPRCR